MDYQVIVNTEEPPTSKSAFHGLDELLEQRPGLRAVVLAVEGALALEHDQPVDGWRLKLTSELEDVTIEAGALIS